MHHGDEDTKDPVAILDEAFNVLSCLPFVRCIGVIVSLGGLEE